MTWTHWFNHRLAEYIIGGLSLAHYACNFFIFIPTGRHFRQALRDLLLCRLDSKASSNGQPTTMTLLQTETPGHSPGQSPARTPGHTPGHSPKPSPGHSPRPSPGKSPRHSPALSPANTQGYTPKFSSPARSPGHSPALMTRNAHFNNRLTAD